MFDASVKSMRDENSKRIAALKQSLASLKNQESAYANDHRRLIAIREEIASVLQLKNEQAA